MTEDARFEDASDRQVKLLAADADDLKVISALTQDAVFAATDLKWEASTRRFILLLNRVRWEDRSVTERPERVRALLIIDDVAAVRSQGVEKGDTNTVLSLLSLDWIAGVDGAGEVQLTLAGDGVLGVRADCINVTLQDVTRPYDAVSGKAPTHPDT